MAVPVPDSGIPRSLVDAARKIVEGNVVQSSGDGRPLRELCGGIIHCAGCGRRMQAHVLNHKRNGKVYVYLRCPSHQDTRLERCPANVKLPAGKVEEAVWEFVSGLLTEPEQMIEAVDRLIEAERGRLRGDPEGEERELRARLETLVRQRGAFQDQQAMGMMTLDELGIRLRQIEESREHVRREIEACENRGERIRELVALRGSLQRRADVWSGLMDKHPDLGQHVVGDMPWASDPFATACGESLEACTPEQRREHYLSLELRVDAHSKEELEISGVFGKETVYIWESSSRRPLTETTS